MRGALAVATICALSSSTGCDRAAEPARVDAGVAPIASSASIASSAPPVASSAPPIADRGRACDFARTALADLASTFPTKCARDAECDGYYLGASACDPALVLAKPGIPPSSEQRLHELQAAARAACLPTIVACAPKPFSAKCRTGRCVDAMRESGAR